MYMKCFIILRDAELKLELFNFLIEESIVIGSDWRSMVQVILDFVTQSHFGWYFLSKILLSRFWIHSKYTCREHRWKSYVNLSFFLVIYIYIFFVYFYNIWFASLDVYEMFIILRDAKLKLELFNCRLHLLQKKQTDCNRQELWNYQELFIISILKAFQYSVRCFPCNYLYKWNVLDFNMLFLLLVIQSY